MKKILSLIAVLCLTSVALAGSPVKVKKGKENVKGLVAQAQEMQVVFDWSKTSYDNRVTLVDQFPDDYEFIQKDCYGSFILGYNENSKTLKLSQQPTDAPYMMVFEVSKLDSYYAVMRIVPKFEGKCWGTIKVVNKATGETMIEIEVDEAEDGTDFVQRECFGKTFLELGEELAKKLK